MEHIVCVQVFSKCGILKENDDGEPRVKLYRDKATNMLKGDGLVTYLKTPSVRLLAGPDCLSSTPSDLIWAYLIQSNWPCIFLKDGSLSTLCSHCNAMRVNNAALV